MSNPIWTPDPDRVEAAQITRFRREVEARHGLSLPDYAALHRWSVEALPDFWSDIWSFCEVLGTRGDGPVLENGDSMPGSRFFPGARLSFSENLLRRDDETEALVFHGEDGARRALSHGELRGQVGALAARLRDLGLAPGDRVAGWLPNAPETVVAMLATASLGAVWSSCSPDFGVRGVVERFGQIEPRVLFAVDGYRYAGREIDLRGRLAEVRGELPSLEAVVGIPFLNEDPDFSKAGEVLAFRDLLRDSAPLDFERRAFDHPLYVLYSSGTTGRPKCIVHSAGGTLLQHLKEHRLQTDLRPDDRFFYFTTCGWMMWNWLVSGLATGATLVLYDGSPFHPGPERLFDLAARERVTVFGTSAKFLSSAEKAGVRPRRTHDLSALRAVLSTGSPLAPEGFEYVYRDLSGDVCLSSISGGTDLIGCFFAGNPAGPVWSGECQVPALGMDAVAADDQGRAVVGAMGELVCRRPFPSMPVGFWNDPGDARYRAAYFERFPGIWHHGDVVEITTHGGAVIYGRSDATLNPGGVRIGTAEIYRPVEKLDSVVEALAVGQPWQDDVRVVLFVKLREGVSLDEALEQRIRDIVRREASPRHVPARILAVPDIPRTKSGKIVELAVREVIAGRPVKNVDALANPEALEHFRNRPELGA